MPEPRHADIRLASWNVHKAVGTDRKRDLARLTRVICEMNPDVMALQETDIRLIRARNVLETDALGVAGLRRVPLPGAADPARGWYGNTLLMGPGVGVGQVSLMRLPGIELRGAIIAELTVRGAPLRVVGTHMALDPLSRKRQARLLRDRLMALPDTPTALMGDTNEWRNGPGALAPLLEYLTLPKLMRTFPAWKPVLPLDRIMVRGAEVLDFGVHRTEASRRASDHLPVRARLVL